MNKEYKNLINIKKKNLKSRQEELEEIFYRIRSSSLLVLEGNAGSGKTSLLKEVVNKFKGRKKVCYIDLSNYKEGINMLNFVKEKKKEMILLLDNVEYLSFQDSEKIKYYFDQDYVSSVVFTTNNFDSVNFSESLKSRIGNNIIKIKDLDKKASFEILEQVFPHGSNVEDKILEQIYNESDSIGMFLEKVDELFSIIKKEKIKKASINDLKKLVEESK